MSTTTITVTDILTEAYRMACDAAERRPSPDNEMNVSEVSELMELFGAQSYDTTTTEAQELRTEALDRLAQRLVTP